MSEFEKYPCAAFIDLDAVEHNYRFAKSLTKSAKVLAVVKADAYGHGAVNVAKRLEKIGADYFAVANIDEALELRHAGIKTDILILGHILDSRIEDAIDADVELAVSENAMLSRIIEKAHGKRVNIHIKLETGMNRTGYFASCDTLSEELMICAEMIKQNPNISTKGIFSHFCVADDDDGDEYTLNQFIRFTSTVDMLEKLGLRFCLRHICNSAATVKYPEYHLDMVRFGLGLYGFGEGEENLAPVMRFSSHIVSVKKVGANESIGYGRSYIAKSERRIATVSAGYADGVPRLLSNKGCVLCRGKKCDIVGRVCMDMLMIDITDFDDIVSGDTVTIFGNDSGNALSVNEVAKFCGTISYELFCSVGKRVPRIYMSENDK